jgi:outer membrane lipoprotein-sorting protein
MRLRIAPFSRRQHETRLALSATAAPDYIPRSLNERPMIKAVPPATNPAAPIARRHLLRGVASLAALLPAACANTGAPALAPNDQATIAQIQSYLDSLRQFRARFTQSGSDGDAEGNIWLDRPGRLRVEYLAPRAKLLLANHGHLLLADQSTGATTTMPVSNTPLDILLADKIALSGAVTVASLQRFPSTLQITLVKTAAPTGGRLTLQFAAAPLGLIGVVILDSQGHTNTLQLTGLTPTATMDPTLFHYYPPAAPPG